MRLLLKFISGVVKFLEGEHDRYHVISASLGCTSFLTAPFQFPALGVNLALTGLLMTS